MGWPETDPVSISRSEIVRIERSLYRLELFHNRWPRGERKIDGVWPGGPIYFGYYLMTRFAPWENEQLACIHDYLIEALSSCLNDVAEHSDRSTIRKPCPGKKWYKPDLTACLPLGLAFLHRLILAKTHSERHQLLSRLSLNNEISLDAALSFRDPDNHRFRAPLSVMSETQQEELIVPQSAEDEDWGPSVAWRWAHARDVLNRWYNNPEHEDLRQRGYVMWDSARLIHWRILDRDWRLLPRVLKREFYGNSIDEEGLELGWPLSWK